MAKIQKFCISEIQSKLYYTSKEVSIEEIFNLLNNLTIDELEEEDININLSIITDKENLELKIIIELNISINLNLNALIFSNDDKKYESNQERKEDSNID